MSARSQGWFCGLAKLRRALPFRTIVAIGLLVAGVPLSVSGAVFVDIPDDHPARLELEALYRRQLTSGCAAGPRFCPERMVTRAELAQMLVRGLHDPGWKPVSRASDFPDMSSRHPLRDWVMVAVAKGILEPCGTTLICPDEVATRGEIARMILRTLWGPGYAPPKSTLQRYADVPLSHPHADWINQLPAEQFVVACDLADGFCPSTRLDAVEAGVLIARTFMLLDAFTPVRMPQCVDPKRNPWRVGGQYLDADNGVISDQPFMLARWQGQNLLSGEVSYDMGAFTGLTTSHQRGYLPESTSGSPGAQLDCFAFGMLINTWFTPHRPIIGGGYNMMYGYRWNAADEPRPFLDPQGRGSSHLVLQAEIGITQFAAWPNASGDPYAVVGQVALFAYLRDRSQPHLPPFAVLALAATSNWTEDWHRQGWVSYDYSDRDTRRIAQRYPAWFSGGQAGSGVWFASGPIANSSEGRFVTTIYSEGQHDRPLMQVSDPEQPRRFWRAHITPENLVNVVDSINASAPCANVGCPLAGYSRNPSDYSLEYAGILAELALLEDTYDISPTRWRPADPGKDQGSLGLSGQMFGVYRYRPAELQ